jgi:hypothetical protein
MGELDCKANISSFAHFQVTISNLFCTCCSCLHRRMPALRSRSLDDARPTTPSTTNQQQQYHDSGDPLLRKFDTARSNYYYEAVRRHYFTINKSRAGMLLLQSIIIPRVRTNNTLLIQYQSLATTTIEPGGMPNLPLPQTIPESLPASHCVFFLGS